MGTLALLRPPACPRPRWACRGPGPHPAPSSAPQGLSHPSSFSFPQVHSGNADYAPGLVLGPGERVGTTTQRSCPRAPRGAVRLRTTPRGEPARPQSGLELKLEVLGAPPGSVDTQEMPSEPCRAQEGVRGKRHPTRIPCRNFQSCGSSWARVSPGDPSGPQGSSVFSCWCPVQQARLHAACFLLPPPCSRPRPLPTEPLSPATPQSMQPFCHVFGDFCCW